MSKLLITGATGNIGRQLVKQLQEANADFVAGINTKPVEGVATVPINLKDKASLTSALHGIDILFLLLPLEEDMIDMAKNAVDAAREAGIRHIVRLGAFGAAPDSSALFSQVQHTLDSYVQASGIPFTIIQPASFMQNWVNYNTQGIKDGVVYAPVGDGKVGWIDTEDVAAVITTVLLDPEKYAGQTLVVTGPENLSYSEAVVIISQALGRSVQYVDVPDEAVIEPMQQWGVPQWNIDFLVSLNNTIRDGDSEGVTSTVENVTGRPPKSFAAFVNEVKQTWL